MPLLVPVGQVLFPSVVVLPPGAVPPLIAVVVPLVALERLAVLVVVLVVLHGRRLAVALSGFVGLGRRGHGDTAHRQQGSCHESHCLTHISPLLFWARGALTRFG